MLEVLDLSAKAQELGISEARLRARALSGEIACIGFISLNEAFGTQEKFLPGWDEELFPLSEWEDFGSPIPDGDVLRGITQRTQQRQSVPRYRLNGWFRLTRSVYQELLTGKNSNLHQRFVWAFDASGEPVAPVEIYGKSVFIKEEDGGYWDNAGTILRPEDCFFLSELSARTKPDSSSDLRKDARETYARIIAALWQKAHGEGGPGRISNDPYTAASSLANLLADAGIDKPSADKIGRVLADEVGATGIKIGNSEKPR